MFISLVILFDVLSFFTDSRTIKPYSKNFVKLYFINFMIEYECSFSCYILYFKLTYFIPILLHSG